MHGHAALGMVCRVQQSAALTDALRANERLRRELDLCRRHLRKTMHRPYTSVHPLADANPLQPGRCALCLSTFVIGTKLKSGGTDVCVVCSHCEHGWTHPGMTIVCRATAYVVDDQESVRG